jgi:hypothetical protein
MIFILLKINCIIPDCTCRHNTNVFSKFFISVVQLRIQSLFLELSNNLDTMLKMFRRKQGMHTRKLSNVSLVNPNSRNLTCYRINLDSRTNSKVYLYELKPD